MGKTMKNHMMLWYLMFREIEIDGAQKSSYTQEIYKAIPKKSFYIGLYGFIGIYRDLFIGKPFRKVQRICFALPSVHGSTERKNLRTPDIWPNCLWENTPTPREYHVF